MKRVISHITATRYDDYNMKCGTNFQRNDFSPINNETKVKLKVDFFKDSNVAVVDFVVVI